MTLVTPVVDVTETTSADVEAVAKTSKTKAAEPAVVEQVEAAAPAVETEEVVEAAAQEVAVVEGSEVAVAKASNTELRQVTTAQFLAAQSDAGFEGLDLGSFSFERIKLDEGKFLMGANDEDLGTSISFTALSTRSLYIVRQSGDKDAEMFYSYCPKGTTTSDGSSSQDTLNKWLEDGFGDAENPLDIKKYLEVMAELTDRDDEHDGLMVSLSIPPASQQRFGGMAFQAARKFNRGLDGVVITATVGAKAGEGSKSFRPWNFKIARVL